jgi:hypothetical protein
MKFNPTNYPAATPVAADALPLWQASSGNIKSATVQALADAIDPLIPRLLTVAVVTGTLTLALQQLVIASSAAPFDLRLPGSSVNEGRVYHVFNSGAGDVTVTPDGSDTVGLAATLVLAQGESVILASDGLGNWATFGAP